MIGPIAGLFVGVAMMCACWATYLIGRQLERSRVIGLVSVARRVTLTSARPDNMAIAASRILAILDDLPELSHVITPPDQRRWMLRLIDGFDQAVRLGVKPNGGI